MTALQETLDITESIEYGTTTGIVYGWNDVKIYIQANWEKEVADCQSDPNWELTDFYIRAENVSAPWTEASVKGPMFYYDLTTNECYNAIGRFTSQRSQASGAFIKLMGRNTLLMINVDDKYRVP